MSTNENVVATTKDWLDAAQGMKITAYDPTVGAQEESQVNEPGQAVNLPAADRARMNQYRPGVQTRPEHV
jgi:hypothetical protein